MTCCQYHYAPSPDGDRGFEVDATRVRLGRGLLDECGDAARALGMTRVALITDNAVGNSHSLRRFTTRCVPSVSTS
jgi:hypothetical protein